MQRWERSHAHVGVNAPSWLTFEIYRPYFDGGLTDQTPIQARGGPLAARLFRARDAIAPRLAMLMPASFRQLLIEESRLAEYQVSRPSDLADDLASNDWRMMTQAYRSRAELDATDVAGLVSWLTATCLPEAVLDVVPADHSTQECEQVLTGLAQYARALALFQLGGLSPATRSAFAPLLAPAPSLAHLQACGVWAYLLARNATDAAAAATYAQQARRIFDEIAPNMSTFDRSLWSARMPLREVTLAERAGELERAWELVELAGQALAQVEPHGPEQDSATTELRRRIIDRRVEIAVKRGDRHAEESTIHEGLKLDPFCVKMRMQAAQSAQRRGDLAGAMAGYLLAARLGPFGTAFALLRAAQCAGQLGRDEIARIFGERAFRAAPRSAKTRAALVRACEATADQPMADVMRADIDGYQTNWHYRMYGSYLNLGPDGSPCLYARIPRVAYEFAAAGDYPRVDLQRVMPPAFRTNLARESGLTEFAVSRPADLPVRARTPAWDQLCQWVDGFAEADPHRRLLTCKLLYHLGFNRVIVDLLPARPASSLHEPDEFHQYALRDLAEYAEFAGRGRPVTPRVRFDMIDSSDCPLYLRFTGATFAVVYCGREKTSVDDAQRWRDRAAELLQAVLASDDFTEFEKVMVHSRFYRGVGFVPFMRDEWSATVEDMDRAIDLALQVSAGTGWEEYLRRENLHAALESRAKVAIRMGEFDLAYRRTEEALAVDPYHPMSNIEMAECQARRGLWAQAGISYVRAARLGPYGTAIAYNMAGECFRKAGESTLAEDCFTQALRVDPYAVSAARGWRHTAVDDAMIGLAHSYAEALREWGEQRRAGARTSGPRAAR